MTGSQFTMWSEATFGKYLPAMKAEVENWLKPHTPYFISALREIALREHPSVYGRPPGVHEVEQWKVEAYQRGHTLEAIASADSGRKLIPEEAGDAITEEEAAQRAAEFRDLMEHGRREEL
jgi:hypothetical protein